MGKSVTVATLAVEYDLDADVALVTLWDHGIDAIEDADKLVPPSLLKAVRKALGGATPREMQRLSYWMKSWGVSREELVRRLGSEFGITVSSGARTLPKGALRRLRGAVRPPVVAPMSRIASVQGPLEPAVPFELKLPGKHKPTDVLTAEDVLAVHGTLVDAFRDSGDPIDPPGVRDENLLHSAVLRPITGIGDVLKYDTIEGHAAALLHSLVHNHPFHNGNKRTALVSMLVLLDRNGILLTCSEQALFKHVLQVAQHRLVPAGSSDVADREVQAIATWVCEHSRMIEKGDRVLTWRELKRILNRLGCTFGTPIPGNKLRIERQTTERRGFLGRRREVVLRITTGYRNDGSEVGRTQLLDIRRELRLSEGDGYDSAYFYGNDSREPDSFIAEYRSLLRRLGRL